MIQNRLDDIFVEVFLCCLCHVKIAKRYVWFDSRDVRVVGLLRDDVLSLDEISRDNK
jgi:hypothetical protein